MLSVGRYVDYVQFNLRGMRFVSPLLEYLNKFERWCANNDPTYYKKILDEAVNEEINRRIEEKQKQLNNSNVKISLKNS